VQRDPLRRAMAPPPRSTAPPHELMPFLRQLGRDHRKFGVVSSQYEAVGTALLSAIRRHSGTAWTPAVERAWAEAYTVMARAMLESAASDEGPAFWPAQVIDHQRLGWDLAKARLPPDYPLAYQAGQDVSLEVPHGARL